MYLSKLEIFGFKSFAHKVTFQFNDGITAVIGPNGCGKSNIVDAIRWVLGEQRPTILRLDRMEDIIFNGTSGRKPLSMVDVSLFIENTRNILPSVYTEVKITRRLYRSGESEYLLNNRQVRLKDIIDLFADTGMGSDAYSVIELKMVEQILSENAEERRRLFEEAAGIKRYKIRRKSAIRKLETTDQELVRLNDVISEVQKTVNSLSRQVGKAKRYHQYKNELKKNELYVYQLKTKRYELDLVPLREEYGQVRQTRERLGIEVNQAEAGIEKLQVKAVDLESQFREVSARLADEDNKVREIQQQVQLNEQKTDSHRQNISDREKQITVLRDRQSEYMQQVKALEQEKGEISGNVEQREEDYQKQTTILKEAEEQLSASRREFQAFHEQNVTYMQNVTHQRDQYHKLTIERENIMQQLDKLAQEKKNIQAEIGSRHGKADEVEKELQGALKDLEVYNHEIDQLQKVIKETRQKTEVLENEKTALLGKLEKNNSRREFLQSLIENYEGFSESVQYVMAHKKNYRGLIDILANMVNTSDEFRPALESYLEEIANFLVVEGVDTARDILSEIRQNKKGRLTLVPLSLLKTSTDGKIKPGELNGNAVFLRDVVSYDSRFEKLFRFLFDRVVLVQDIDSALQYREKYPDLRFLTREGDLVGEWGHITGGNSHHSVNLTGRKHQFEGVLREAEELTRQQELQEKSLREHQDSLHKNRLRLEEVETLQKEQTEGCSALVQQLHQEKYEAELWQQRLTELENSRSDLNHRNDELAEQELQLSPAIREADERQQKYQEEEKRITRHLELSDERYRHISGETQQQHIKLLEKQNYLKEIIQKLGFINDSIRESEQRSATAQEEISRFKTTIEALQNDIESARRELEVLYEHRDVVEKEKAEIENNYQSLKSLIMSREDEVKKLHRHWNQSLERLKELELKIQEIEIKLKSQKEMIQEQYGAELGQLLAENPVPDTVILQDSQNELQNIRRKIEVLGEVNPLAIKEFEKEKERLDFLKSQQTDLLEARKELLETINKLNKTARKLFLETFEKINQNFRAVFGKFFEGGSAELVLIDNDDPLESNIDISVHIKGRRLTTLNLLSAGEKTLTAISLLFAIYLYKPSPFCILDEVDAPLDDVNIARYTHALKEFSQNTQFILVTHNKMTMQAAQSMYGITMEEAGVSKVVSVRFN
jgi:chromosome segregation protein